MQQTVFLNHSKTSLTVKKLRRKGQIPLFQHFTATGSVLELWLQNMGVYFPLGGVSFGVVRL